MSLIIGNLIALIGSILMVYSGILKEKNKFYMLKQFKLGCLLLVI